MVCMPRKTSKGLGVVGDHAQQHAMALLVADRVQHSVVLPACVPGLLQPSRRACPSLQPLAEADATVLARITPHIGAWSRGPGGPAGCLRRPSCPARPQRGCAARTYTHASSTMKRPAEHRAVECLCIGLDCRCITQHVVMDMLAQHGHMCVETPSRTAEKHRHRVQTGWCNLPCKVHGQRPTAGQGGCLQG